MTRNPTWSREELILALDLYLRGGFLDDRHPDVVELSELLNRIAASTPTPTFRNPNGVSMKLGNFRSLDPSRTGVGLPRIGRGDAAVWAEFANDRPRLAAEAREIRRRALAAQPGEAASNTESAAVGIGLIGRPFTPANESMHVASREPFDVDPDAVDRGTRGHAQTLNALASWVRANGLEPREADVDDPQFDLAWRDEPRLCVAEVKSLTKRNEEHQLRLGIGQLLRYRQALFRSR